MAITFPSAATTGDLHIEGNKTWRFNGVAWDVAKDLSSYMQDAKPSEGLADTMWMDTSNGSLYYKDDTGVFVGIRGATIKGVTYNSDGHGNNATECMIIGGQSNTSTYRSNIYKYDVASNSVAAHGNTGGSVARADSAAVSDHSQTMSGGGFVQGTGEVANIDMTQFSANTFSIGHGYLNTATMNNNGGGDESNALFLGGKLAGNNRLTTIEKALFSSNTTAAQFGNLDPYTNQGVSNHGVTSDNRNVFLVGGTTTNGASTIKYYYVSKYSIASQGTYSQLGGITDFGGGDAVSDSVDIIAVDNVGAHKISIESGAYTDPANWTTVANTANGPWFNFYGASVGSDAYFFAGVQDGTTSPGKQDIRKYSFDASTQATWVQDLGANRFGANVASGTS